MANEQTLSSTHTEESQTKNSPFSNWGIYAAAAGATLAMSTGAQAGVITYQAVNLTVLPDPPARSVLKSFTFLGQAVFARLSHGATSGAAAVLDSGGGPLFFASYNGGKAHRYAAGDNIHFAGTVQNVSLREAFGAFHSGPFGPGDAVGYLGFRDLAGQFGWLKIELSDTGDPGYPNELQILSYAYDQTVGEAIVAGDTGVSAAPEPGTKALALLALGSSAILAWRRRRAEVASK